MPAPTEILKCPRREFKESFVFQIFPDEPPETSLLRAMSLRAALDEVARETEIFTLKIIPLLEEVGLNPVFLRETDLKGGSNAVVVERERPTRTSWFLAVEEGIAQVMDMETKDQDREVWMQMLERFCVSLEHVEMGSIMHEFDQWKVMGRAVCFSRGIEESCRVIESLTAFSFVSGEVLMKIKKRKGLIINVIDLEAGEIVGYLARRENGGFVLFKQEEKPELLADSSTLHFNIYIREE